MIGVGGLNSVMNHFFLLREANYWCTGTQFCHESYYYCGRRTIGVSGLNSVIKTFFLRRVEEQKKFVLHPSTLLCTNVLDVCFLVLARFVVKIMVKNTLVKTHKRSQV